MRKWLTQTADEAMAVITRAVLDGKRCPKNRGYGERGEDELHAAAVYTLTKRGDIRVEISGHNYRRIVILTGPHAGKGTAPDPAGNFVWRVIDAGRRAGAA